MELGFKVRVFNNRTDSERVVRLISDIIVNEFEFKLDFDGLDSDISCIEEHYKKSDGGCFWVAESTKNCDNDKDNNKKCQIVGTTALRNLKQFESTAELKRMYVLRQFRKLGIGQKMLDIAVDFAKSFGYKRIVLDSSKYLYVARHVYLKKGFVDISRYNNNYRANVFMEKKL
jgi:GNAT superfamily N-acetyltransferase